MTNLLTYYKAHRKALVGAASTSAGIALAEIKAGQKLDWFTILAPIISGVIGGGLIHATTNTPPTGGN